jgi:2-methylcitrate dehydratase PrpD
MNPNNTIAEKLSSYIVSTTYGDIPERILKKVKQVFLDSLCCVIGGSQTTVGQISAKVMKDVKGKRESTILGRGGKFPAPNAAFANSMMANALDFDDTFPWAGHPGSTIIPPALAIGEKMASDGKAILLSILLGYEISGRIGIAVRPSPEGLKKVWGYGTWQTFGATVVAGKLLGLSARELNHAFGIAGCNAPVPSLYKSCLGPSGTTMVKNNYGTASQVGILSALLAAEGFQGPIDIFEGDKGFWRMAGSDRCDFEALTQKLHEDFKIEQIAFKPYPSVRWNHSAIDGVLKIVHDNRLNIEEVEKIEVRSFHLVTHHPFDLVEPKDLGEAVFSTPFDIAVAIAGIPPGPDWYAQSQLTNPLILNLAKKVELIEDPEANESYPSKLLSKVTIKARSRVFEMRVDYPKGEVQNPLSQEDLENKFRGVAYRYLTREKAERIIRLVNSLENLKDIRDLTKMLIFNKFDHKQRACSRQRGIRVEKGKR